MKVIITPLLAIVFGMIMVILDSTVINVALNNFQQVFGSTISTTQWTVTGYTLALSAVIPLAGWLTDKFGSKRIFLITISIFTISSVLCASAQSMQQLIFYRVIQGLGGGMIAPIGMALIFRLAPPDKRGSVMGLLGVPMLIAPIVGPSLSGWLIEFASWEWIFLINVPIGFIAFLLGKKHLPESEKTQVPGLDILGMILAPIAFTALAYGFTEGGRSNWTSNETFAGLIIGGIALLLFIIVELRHKQPLLELRVFRSPHFTRGVLLMWLAQICLFGVNILIPLFLQSIKHYTSFNTGLTLLPQAVAAMIFISVGGKLYDKFGARPVSLAGFTIVTIALFMFAQLGQNTSPIWILLPLFLIGAGMGLTVMTLETYVLSSAPYNLVGRVTPLTTSTLQVATSIAVAGLTGLLASRTSVHTGQGGHEVNELAAFVSAFDETFYLTAGIAIIGVIIGIFLRKPQVYSNDEQSKNPIIEEG
ncbi:multidrug efflux MFS transporter [Paenibacillus sp. KQZ6P-2]|uniref:Multidrug efflux MFS transporter n=1 Tax=Paenibacillus mangrovi TaxID=2931978 RepID=A0A9X2B6T6_9BACL|nr:MDR family MFS transporter [Paenibacillus mangrovi]MCJ8014147.1 multidrug efflux MFS transporter [Paenibacillus mangrovi]